MIIYLFIFLKLIITNVSEMFTHTHTHTHSRHWATSSFIWSDVSGHLKYQSDIHAVRLAKCTNCVAEESAAGWSNATMTYRRSQLRASAEEELGHFKWNPVQLGNYWSHHLVAINGTVSALLVTAYMSSLLLIWGSVWWQCVTVLFI